MSDSNITIVPKVSTYPNREKKSAEILEWLIRIGVVKPTLSSCILGLGMGYSIAEEAKYLVTNANSLPFGLAVNGLEIITKREVFDAGDNGIDMLVCPNCKQDISMEEWDLTPWADNETDNLTCPQCRLSAEVNTYAFEPAWGFSNLGFRFWNWPDITPEFVAHFEKVLGGEVRVIRQHI